MNLHRLLLRLIVATGLTAFVGAPSERGRRAGWTLR